MFGIMSVLNHTDKEHGEALIICWILQVTRPIKYYLMILDLFYNMLVSINFNLCCLL